jgi:hypothetical protein|tara:strand:+ start:1483 stop:1719 length:237 start_codon:yes stop_codon:yes gene_type:complete
MIDEWRYNPERLEERRFCLGALMFFEVPIDKDVYYFCDEYVNNDSCRELVDEFHEKGQTYLWQQIKDAYDTWKHERNV